MVEDLEVWVELDRFHGLIEVSSAGRIKKSAYSVHQGRGKGCVRHIPERVLKPRRHPWGYGWVEFSIGGNLTWDFVHRLVAEGFLGRCPDKHYVLHYDNDPTNNAISNLRYGTPTENCADKKRHGTQPVGEQIYNAKLTAEQVVEMRERRAAGEKLLSIGIDFAMSEALIHQICTGIKWASAGGPLTAPTKKLKTMTEGDIKVAHSMRESGKFLSEIADELGFSRNQIWTKTRAYENSISDTTK